MRRLSDLADLPPEGLADLAAGRDLLADLLADIHGIPCVSVEDESILPRELQDRAALQAQDLRECAGDRICLGCACCLYAHRFLRSLDALLAAVTMLQSLGPALWQQETCHNVNGKDGAA